MSALSITRSITLNDGLKIPQLGLGVYLSRGAAGIEAVRTALTLGLRHLDGAQWYENEAEMGEGFRASGVPRSEVWITSKIWDSAQSSYDSALRSVEESLRKSKLDYLDLMLIHSPNPGKERRLETWRALIEAKKRGLVKSIGVSNYGAHHLDELLEKYPNDPPSLNQIEISPFFQRTELVEACKKRNIAIEAYSPLGKGAHVDAPNVKKIAQRIAPHLTPSHVLIRWSLQKGYICIPKSSNPDRIRANADVFGFEISPEDMAALDALETGEGVTWNPTLSP